LVRVSTREQDIAGVSPDEQWETIETFCAAHKLPQPLKYFDVESGTEEAEADREDFQRLLKEARHGDLVMVAKFDRFSRDLAQPLVHIRNLSRKGAIFYSISEHLDSRDPHAEMLVTAWAMGASIEHKRIRERTEGGRRLLRRRGCFVEGKAPFGYTRPPHDRVGTHHHLIIDPRKAHIVRTMFERAANGWGVRPICEALLREHPNELAWGRAWVLRVLRNRIYTGQVATTPVRPQGGNNVRQLPAEWVDSHPAIVSLDIYNTVQAAISARRRPGRPPSAESSTAAHLLRGIARCTYCNAVMACIPPNKKVRRLTGYYVCNRKLRPEHETTPCVAGHYHRQDDIDSEVAADFTKRLVALRRTLGSAPRERERPDFNGRRRDLEKQRRNVVDAIAAGVITLNDAKAKITDIDDKVAALRAAEAEFRQSVAHDTAEARAAAKAYVAQVEAEWFSWSVEVRREFLKAFAAKITIGGPAVVMAWHDAAEIASLHHEGRMPPIYRPSLDELPALPPPRASALEHMGAEDSMPSAARQRAHKPPALRPPRASVLEQMGAEKPTGAAARGRKG